MKFVKSFLSVALISLTFISVSQAALKTFILAKQAKGDQATVVAETKQKLTDAGFTIAGEYSPYSTATIIIVTNDELKKNAGESEFGAFGAAQRVTVTTVENEVQVAFTNPVYMANAYRMDSNLKNVAAKLKSALGDNGEYGPESGLEAKDLRDYQYKWLMPYFTDRLELADFGSYQVALSKVNASLSGNNKTGVKKVFQVDIPGKQESVIGVHMTGPESAGVDCSGDQYIMEKIDFKKVKSTGHLPYEVVVSGGKVYALPAEFRIAISFPDLSMMGSNSFASIMCAPSAIQEALTVGVGGEYSED